jgi:nucleoside-diphosphate-sugar epimerase
MQNAINACKESGAKLIFFDNVYSYGKVDGRMTEETPYNPCSKKGEVRAGIAEQLENEYRHKNLDAIIARAADLYGPYGTLTSVPYFMIFERMLKGKKAQWMVNPDKVHTHSYTLDCAKGLKLLAEDPKSYNQTWHLPSSNPPIDGKTFIKLAADELGKKPDYSLMKKGLLKLVGLFNRTVAEINEMLYQYEYDYYFDSTKFEKYFNYKPISYREGIHETIEFLKETGIE